MWGIEHRNLHVLQIFVLLSITWCTSSAFESLKHFSGLVARRGEMENLKGHSPLSEPSGNCLCMRWTEWMSLGSPQELENIPQTYSSLLKYGIVASSKHVDICAAPVSSDCQILVQGYDENGNNDKHVACPYVEDESAPSAGLVQIRFLCWDWKCPCLQWSEWYNEDRPSGNGDMELLGQTITREKWPCPHGSRPLDVECRTADGRTLYETKNRMLKCNLDGFKCLNNWQSDRCTCEDYKVRFLCWAFLEQTLSSSDETQTSDDYGMADNSRKVLHRNRTLDQQGENRELLEQSHRYSLGHHAEDPVWHNKHDRQSTGEQQSYEDTEAAKFWVKAQSENLGVELEPSLEKEGADEVASHIDDSEKLEGDDFEGASVVKLEVDRDSAESPNVIYLHKVTEINNESQHQIIDERETDPENAKAKPGPPLHENALQGEMEPKSERGGNVTRPVMNDFEEQNIEGLGNIGQVKTQEVHALQKPLSVHHTKMVAELNVTKDTSLMRPHSREKIRFDNLNQEYESSRKESKVTDAIPATATVAQDFKTLPSSGYGAHGDELVQESKTYNFGMAATQKLTELQDLTTELLDVTLNTPFGDSLSDHTNGNNQKHSATMDVIERENVVTQSAEMGDSETRSQQFFTIHVTVRDGLNQYSVSTEHQIQKLHVEPAVSQVDVKEKLPEAQDLRSLEPNTTSLNGVSQGRTGPKDHYKVIFIESGKSHVDATQNVGGQDLKLLLGDVNSTTVADLQSGREMAEWGDEDWLERSTMKMRETEKNVTEVPALEPLSAQSEGPVEHPYSKEKVENVMTQLTVDPVTPKLVNSSVHNASLQSNASEQWDKDGHIAPEIFHDVMIPDLVPLSSRDLVDDHESIQKSYADKDSSGPQHNREVTEESSIQKASGNVMEPSIRYLTPKVADPQEQLYEESTLVTDPSFQDYLGLNESDVATHNLGTRPPVATAPESVTMDPDPYAEVTAREYSDVSEYGVKEARKQPQTDEDSTKKMGVKESGMLIPELIIPTTGELMDREVVRRVDAIAPSNVDGYTKHTVYKDVAVTENGITELNTNKDTINQKSEVLKLDPLIDKVTDSYLENRDATDYDNTNATVLQQSRVQKERVKELKPLISEFVSTPAIDLNVDDEAIQKYAYSTMDSGRGSIVDSVEKRNYIGPKILSTEPVPRKTEDIRKDYSILHRPVFLSNHGHDDEIYKYEPTTVLNRSEETNGENGEMMSTFSQADNVPLGIYLQGSTVEAPLQQHERSNPDIQQEQQSLYDVDFQSRNPHSNYRGTGEELETAFRPRFNLNHEWEKHLTAGDRNPMNHRKAFAMQKWQLESEATPEQQQRGLWSSNSPMRSYRNDGKKFTSGNDFTFNKHYSNMYSHHHKRHPQDSRENEKYSSILKRILQSSSPGLHRITKFRNDGSVDYEVYVRQH